MPRFSRITRHCGVRANHKPHKWYSPAREGEMQIEYWCPGSR